MTENESENLTKTPIQNMTETVSENLTEIPIQNMTENDADNNIDNLTEIPIENVAEKGKRKMYERFLNESSSEFDDSSDEDYVQSNDGSDSDTPSVVLEDIECDSDDDIFLNKNPSKKELLMKLKRVMKEKIKTKGKLPETTIQTGDLDWASDDGDGNDDELYSLLNSEDEDAEKHPIYKTTTSMKSLNLVVGLKFKNASQYRDVLRDWCIRNGVDIEFIRNEAARVTAKCKANGCEWRIHASPVMGGPTFQIKTIKGKHNCARTYDNSLANASYLAKRIEKSLRDHPTIPVAQLKNRILSKCNVEVSRFKVMRARKEALRAIRGDDAKQYQLLWDYCETVRKSNPGSKLIIRKVENSDPPVFDRMYFSLWALKKGFLEGCRPIIGLHGCFLKSVYGGNCLWLWKGMGMIICSQLQCLLFRLKIGRHGDGLLVSC